MTWEPFVDWDTLWVGRTPRVRLYHAHYLPRWTVRAIGSDARIQLDPDLTLEEAKLIVQTLAGAQL